MLINIFTTHLQHFITKAPIIIVNRDFTLQSCLTVQYFNHVFPLQLPGTLLEFTKGGCIKLLRLMERLLLLVVWIPVELLFLRIMVATAVISRKNFWTPWSG